MCLGICISTPAAFCVLVPLELLVVPLCCNFHVDLCTESSCLPSFLWFPYRTIMSRHWFSVIKSLCVIRVPVVLEWCSCNAPGIKQESRILVGDIFYSTNCMSGIDLDVLLNSKHSSSGDLMQSIPTMGLVQQSLPLAWLEYQDYCRSWYFSKRELLRLLYYINMRCSCSFCCSYRSSYLAFLVSRRSNDMYVSPDTYKRAGSFNQTVKQKSVFLLWESAV